MAGAETTLAEGKARGGLARARALTPERRQEIARQGALSKAQNAKLPKATHGSIEHPIKIGDIELPCFVLEDGTRVLTQRGVMSGLGISRGSTSSSDDRLTRFMESTPLQPETLHAIKNPIKFANPKGGRTAYGYPATLFAEICDAILAARKSGSLSPQQIKIADQAELLVRGFARVGIIALVDEATGYQRDRAKNALAEILEAFVASELQPYVKTFPADFYEQLFRLRELEYPPENAQYRPMYFGLLTNDIIYRRLAPGILEELKKQNSTSRKKGKLHQRLTTDIGHPKLRELLVSVITIMKLSNKYADFIEKINRVHPRYGDTLSLDLHLDSMDR